MNIRLQPKTLFFRNTFSQFKTYIRELAGYSFNPYLSQNLTSQYKTKTSIMGTILILIYTFIFQSFLELTKANSLE